MSQKLPGLLNYSGFSKGHTLEANYHIESSFEDVYSNHPGNGLKIRFRIQVAKEKDILKGNYSEKTFALADYQKGKPNLSLPSSISKAASFNDKRLSSWQYGCPGLGKTVLARFERKILGSKISYPYLFELTAENARNLSNMNKENKIVASSVKGHVIVASAPVRLSNQLRGSALLDLEMSGVITSGKTVSVGSSFFEMKGICTIFHSNSPELTLVR